MKQLLQFAPLILGLAACQSHSDTPVAAAATPQKAAQAAPPKAESGGSEHIEASMVTVIGLPQEEVSTKQLISQLGRPDSVAKGAAECGSRLATPIGSPAGDFWYYGKTMYEVSGTQAILCSFSVTSGKFKGKIGKLLLNQNTTLEDVRHYFPEAAKEADQPATGRAGEVMSLPFFYKGVPMDEAIVLRFQQGHLQAVEFFSPC